MSFIDKLRSQKLLSITLMLFTLSIGIVIGTLVNSGVKAARDNSAAPDATPLVIPSPVELSNTFSQIAKQVEPAAFTKSGLMVGLGEEPDEILAVMDALRAAEVDFLTIGQYLRPTPRHAPVARYVAPEEFAELREAARARGFLLVSASPLTRSSYHADEDFQQLRLGREAAAQRAAGERSPAG